MSDTTRTHQPGDRDATRTGAPVPDTQTNLTHVTTADEQARLAAELGGISVPGFEIAGTLGSGSFGVVYKAKQVGLNRVVALKMLIAGPYASPALRARFLLEAESVAALEHPHIVRVFAFGERAGHPYIAMEHLPGGTLAQRIKKNGPLSPGAATELVAKLADAVAHAHSRGVVHRDIKPGNVLLTAEGEPRLTDFGLAKVGRSDMTATGQILGTPAYMSPEQAAGKVREVGTSSDVYALGAVLYHALTGRPPFRGDSAAVTLQKVLTEEPERPRKLNASIPRDLETVCLKCLQKEPAQRYATALDLASDLDSYRAGRPMKARPVGWPVRAWRWCRRNPVLAAVTLAATLATASAVGLLVGLVAYQARAGRDLEQKQLATQAALTEKQGALAQAESNYRDVQRQSALLALDRGVSLCEAGDAAQGVLFLVAGLEFATQSGDSNLQRFVRTSLGAWRRQLVPLKSMVRHQGEPEATALSPDGRHVATVGSGGAVLLRDVATGETIGVPLRADKKVTRVAYSPDGKSLAVCDASGAVRLFEAGTGKPVGHPMAHDNVIEALAFAPDSQRVATGCNGSVRVWAVGSAAPVGKPVRVGQAVRSIAFDPAGRLLAVSGGEKPNDPLGEAWLWPSAGAENPARLDAEGNVYRAVFLPGRGAVLTLSKVEPKLAPQTPPPAGSRVRAWSVADGRQLARPWEWSGTIEQLVSRPDGQTVAVVRGQEAVLVSVNLDNVEAPCLSASGDDGPSFLLDSGPPRLAHLWSVTAVAFSPDGARVLTTGLDGVAQLWDAQGRRLGESMDHQGQVTGAAFDPSGQVAMTICKDGLVRFWDVRVAPMFQFRTAGAEDDARALSVFGDRQNPAGVALGPDGRVLTRLVAPGPHLPGLHLELWDTSRGKLIREPFDFTSGLDRIAHGRGSVLAHFQPGRSVRLWDTGTGKAIGEPFAADRWTDVAALSPDGRTAVTAEKERVFRWELSTSQPIGEPLITDGAVTCLAYLPSGTIVSGHLDGTVRLWNGTPAPPTVLRGRLGEVRSLDVAPDGKRLLVVGAEAGAAGGTPGPRTGSVDRTRVVAQVWEIGTGRAIGEPLTHDGNVAVASFSPDGTVIATGAGNEARTTGEARLWDAASARPLGPVLAHDNRVTALAFGPNGLLATGSADQTARLWDVGTGRALGPPVPLLRPASHDEVGAVRFTGDAALVLSGSVGVQSWPSPRPLEAVPEHLRLWAEVISGKELDTAAGTRVLTPEAWWDRRRRLDALGAPAADPVMIAPLQERRKRFKELRDRTVPPLGLAGG